MMIASPYSSAKERKDARRQRIAERLAEELREKQAKQRQQEAATFKNQFNKALNKSLSKGRSDLTTPFVPASDLSRFFVVRKKGRSVIAEFFDSDTAETHCKKLCAKVGGKRPAFAVQPLAWVLSNCEG